MPSQLKIYRLVPTADENDQNWDIAPNQGEVVVRALNTGDARLIASQAENDFLEISSSPAEGVSTTDASAFRNEKLYTVVEDLSNQFAAEGPRALLSGDIQKHVVASSEG